MRVAVTGGAGYIGSIVTETLLAGGHEVLVIDNLVKGHRDAVMAEATFAQIHLADGEAVAAGLRRFGCEAVIHMADLARAHVLALEALDAVSMCEIYNLGCGGAGYSVRDVIEASTRITNRSIAVELAPRRPGDPAILVASSGRIRQALGWVPAFQQLDEIIASAWHRMNVDA